MIIIIIIVITYLPRTQICHARGTVIAGATRLKTALTAALKERGKY